MISAADLSSQMEDVFHQTYQEANYSFPEASAL